MQAETPEEREARLERLKQRPPRERDLVLLIKDALPIVRAVADNRPLSVDFAREMVKRMEEATGPEPGSCLLDAKPHADVGACVDRVRR